ncbi:hypothetical protein V4C85_02325 [Ralstonia solanacearum]|uniref:hypothetical protein n=1 Tax=Ralstonia solanacearum TaxID=305 RepID=UPI0007C87EF4|nr:hypothetical protein [Ralstonia solanacearum]OAI76926.1 hypothetical protein RSP597_06485 [Ralstonia solanacearum]
MIRRLFGRAKPAATDALPAEVATIIAGAGVLPRGDGEDGAPRIVITTTHGAFAYHRDAARAWFIARWPALTDAQMRRALALLESHVRERMARIQNDDLQRLAANRRRWKDHARDSWLTME